MADIKQAAKWMQKGKIVRSAGDNLLPHTVFRVREIALESARIYYRDPKHTFPVGDLSWERCWGFGIVDIQADDWEIFETEAK
jgi:hypothetical protein